MAEPNVLVLVLNYNGGAFLETCLRSLQATTYPAARLLVLDNGSTDGSVGIPRRLGVETVEYGENLGYCAAYNRAFRERLGDSAFVLLSNPDLVVPPATIAQMVATALRDASTGFVGPLQLHEDVREVRSAGIRWRCGRLPDHVLQVGEAIDALEGAFLLVRRQVIERVGGLDERFALNLEDVEWQRRASRQGFRSVLAPEATVFHRRPATERVSTGAYYQTRNVCLLTSTYCEPGALRALRRRLRWEGIAARILGRPRGRYILEGLRDFRDGVTGMKAFR